jgi:hypothetical protein
MCVLRDDPTEVQVISLPLVYFNVNSRLHKNASHKFWVSVRSLSFVRPIYSYIDILIIHIA